MYNTLVISSGHSVNCQGASDYINEVAEAIKVTDRVHSIVSGRGKECYKYHDTDSSERGNLRNIVNFHNNHPTGVDVSIHFNAYIHGDAPKGVEVCYFGEKTRQLAADVSKAIADASGLINRGAKQRDGLYFLKNTVKPAILIEVCFVDSKADVDIYHAKFNEICDAIANALVGTGVSPTPQPTPQPAPQPTPPRPSGDSWVRRLQEECNRQGFSNQKVDGIPGINTLNGCPLVRPGARGNITKLLQEKLVSLGYNTNGVDGIYGGGTTNAVRSYQRSRGLSADGICGRNTWSKLLGL